MLTSHTYHSLRYHMSVTATLMRFREMPPVWYLVALYTHADLSKTRPRALNKQGTFTYYYFQDTFIHPNQPGRTLT